MSDNGVPYLLIRIDSNKCIRCYTCLANCPTDALRLDKGHFTHNKEECCFDEVCQDVCPHDALKILDIGYWRCKK